MVKTIQEKLLEKYKKFLHFKANQYSKAGLKYDDVFNEGYLSLLENYPQYTSSIELRRKIDSSLMAYYRQEIRERHITYGTNSENIRL